MFPVVRLGQDAEIELEIAEFAVFQVAAMAQIDVLALAEIIGVQIVVRLARMLGLIADEFERWKTIRDSHDWTRKSTKQGRNTSIYGISPKPWSTPGGMARGVFDHLPYTMATAPGA